MCRKLGYFLLEKSPNHATVISTKMLLFLPVSTCALIIIYTIPRLKIPFHIFL